MTAAIPAPPDSPLIEWPAEGDSRAPYGIYTDPRVFAREIERIFEGPTWSFLALDCELPNPGDVKRTYIGTKSVIVVRGEDGAARAFVNRCAHRGVEICQANFASSPDKVLICPYHQWTYNLQGRLTALPMRRGVRGNGGMPQDFDMARHGLTPVTVVARNGAIFGTLSDHPPAFAEYLGPQILAFYDRVFDGRGLTLLGQSRQRIPANWKMMLENIKDTVHASLLHVFFVTFGIAGPNLKARILMDESGLHTAIASQRGDKELNEATAEIQAFKSELELNDPRLIAFKREFPGEATGVIQTIFPNLILQQQSNTLATRQIVVKSADEFELHWTFFGYETDDEDMRMRRLRQANLMGPGGLVSMDDSEVLERMQDGIRRWPRAAAVVEMDGHGYDDADHAVTDVALRAFYRGYRHVMDL